MIAYLGAILRYNDTQREPFTITIAQDSTVKSASPEPSLRTILFHVRENGSGHLSVSYNGHDFSVDDVDPKFPKADYTRMILSILSTLVNYSAQSNATQTSAPIRLLPLP